MNILGFMYQKFYCVLTFISYVIPSIDVDRAVGGHLKKNYFVFLKSIGHSKNYNVYILESIFIFTIFHFIFVCGSSQIELSTVE